jgi:hypothetical protein
MCCTGKKKFAYVVLENPNLTWVVLENQNLTWVVLEKKI